MARTPTSQPLAPPAAQHVHANLRRFPPASLCYAMLGLARLGLPPRQALLDDFVAASYAKIPNFTAHEFTHAAQALAIWRYAPSDEAVFGRWWERFTYSLEKRSFEPRLVCDILVAFAQLDRSPDDLVVQDLLLQVRWQAARLLQATAASCVASAPSPASARLHSSWAAKGSSPCRALPPLQVKDVGLFHVPPESLKQLLVALHALGHRPGSSWLYYYAQMVRFWWTNMSGQQFGAVFRTLAAMGHRPDAVWWADMLARLQCRCDSLDAQVGCAGARRGAPAAPAAWAAGCARCLRHVAVDMATAAAAPVRVPAVPQCCVPCCLQSLTDVLVGVASFSASSSKRPSSTWLRYMAARLHELLPSATALQLGEALGALAQLGAAPGQQWLDEVASAAAALEATAAEQTHVEQQLAALAGSRSNVPASAGSTRNIISAVPAVVYAL